MCEQMGLLDWLEGVELTDTAGLVDRTGLDAHLAALGVDDTRAVRPNETRLGLALERVHDLSGTQPRIQIAARKMMMTAHLDLVQLGNTFRDPGPCKLFEYFTLYLHTYVTIRGTSAAMASSMLFAATGGLHSN